MAPDSTHSAQPWTATRCHRLLRPLLAHIAALRKEKARRDLMEAGILMREPGEAGTTGTAGKRGFSDTGFGHSERKRRKIHNTYTSRSSRKAALASSATPRRHGVQPQQRLAVNKPSPIVAMPTPFLRRVRGHQLSSPTAVKTALASVAPQTMEPPSRPHARKGRCHAVEGCTGSRCFFEMRLSELRRGLDSASFTLYESVVRALDSLLKAANPLKTQAAASRSLLAMCLRKLPAYIGELERWEQRDAKANGTKSTLNDSEISFEVYSDLESLGSVDGWKNLCLAVRAHGIRVIREAILEDLIDDEVADLLIMLCLTRAPLVECEGLIDTFINRQYPGPTHATETFQRSLAFQPLTALCGYAEALLECGTDLVTDRALRVEFELGKLAHLLANGFLPVDWLQTKWFSNTLSKTLQLFAMKLPSYQGIVDFFSIAIKLLCRSIATRRRCGTTEDKIRNRANAQRILTEYVAVLTSMILLGREGRELESRPGEYLQHEPQSSTTGLTNRVEYVLTTCISKANEGRRGLWQDTGVYLLSLSLFLSFGNSESGSGTVRGAWQDAIKRDDPESLVRLYDATLAHIGAVAHHYNRGTQTSGDDYLSVLCDRLETLDIPSEALINLRVDGVFYLAERSGDLRDLAFAESLKARTAAAKNGYRPTYQNNNKREGRNYHMEEKNLRAGFRWDEDIGEWVIAGENKPLKEATSGPRRSTRISSNTGLSIRLPTAAPPTVRRHTLSKSIQRLPTPVSQYSDQEDNCSDAISEASEADDDSDEYDNADYSEDEEMAYTPNTEVSTVSALSPDSLRRSELSRQTPHGRVAQSLSPLPRRNTPRVAAKPQYEEGDELAPESSRKGRRGFKALRRSYSGRRGRGSASLLSLQPLKRPARTVVSYDSDCGHGSSEDELSFGVW